MDEILKPYLPGTIESYVYRVEYKANGGIFYMDIPAENEEEAKTRLRKEYFKSDGIEIIKAYIR